MTEHKRRSCFPKSTDDLTLQQLRWLKIMERSAPAEEPWDVYASRIIADEQRRVETDSSEEISEPNFEIQALDMLAELIIDLHNKCRPQ